MPRDEIKIKYFLVSAPFRGKVNYLLRRPQPHLPGLVLLLPINVFEIISVVRPNFAHYRIIIEEGEISVNLAQVFHTHI